MKKLFIVSVVFAFLGCKEAIKNEVSQNLKLDEVLYEFEEPVVTENLVMTTKEDLLGYWVGDYTSDITPEEEVKFKDSEDYYEVNYNKRISISIDNIIDTIVNGHPVVSGNIRPFKGSLVENEKGFYFKVSEPGDDKYDGKFEFSILKNDSIINGKWQANEVLRIDRRRLKLYKKVFEYNADNELSHEYIDWDKSKKVKYKDVDNDKEYEWEDEEYFTTTGAVLKVNTSKDKVTKEFAENLTKADIFILRNSIYARHGYSFKNRQLRSYFEDYDWYMPVFTDVKKTFTKIENIDLLLLYEENAEEYYDRFGR
ncbi:YARHG domain-containing protein [Flavobacterium sp.]|jgi:hypothetical protein|uniref:YARHG domain-containing protein n=1 Tax=Flavobacterium sp. TaxID=239 RepID=UPI002A7F1294|nr:YARHG domain-containing protein [Flavobacterium sp.]